ncbi:hypothetical protein ASG43_12470 [Aureimonas sp. Leaf454]|uniref:hypothetical protein n=1 Tax=Aureimonas sp. Leaf454 TaxID=1736381 RepID=UPI0006F49665|nr:hypothetical protein [Aureimonas sp. Leaf454]KQT45114.1 hypothetical protein ASG43_12470 [Aureimonas sp. Leaf454]
MSRFVRHLVAVTGLFGIMLGASSPVHAGDIGRGGRSTTRDVHLANSNARDVRGRDHGLERTGSGSFDHVVVGGGSFVSTHRYIDDRRGTIGFDADLYEGRHDRSFDGRTSGATKRYRDRDRDRFDNETRRAGGSFIRLRDAGRIDRFGRDPRYDGRRDAGDRYDLGDTLTTFDVGDWRGGSSIVAYGLPSYGDPASLSGPSLHPGPKIIDIETERLDRRPIGPSGLDVVDTGGARIIRIAPGYRMKGRTAETKRVAAGRDLGRQPWSAAWLTHCSRTHSSFDPELGTYVTPSGKVRFCNAE